MTAKVTLEGVNDLSRTVDNIRENKIRMVISEIFKSGLKIESDSKKLIARGPSRTGVSYTRNNVTRTRSAPGEPPKTDTGRLVNSINTKNNISQSGAESIVGTRLRYGFALEIGTSRIRPRPWLGRTYRENIRQIEKNIDKVFREATRKSL